MNYSTCSGCGALLIVTDSLTHHNGIPPCTPKLSKAGRLEREWQDAVNAGDAPRAGQIQQQIDEIDARPPRLSEAALAYAAWGWPVFPLKSQSKQPATRHGFKDATTDPGRVKLWWDRHPDSNIGLPTGLAFDVIDFDPPIGSYSYLELFPDLPDVHGQTATASGGIHLYVKPSGRGNRAGLRPGVDWRGQGGYVVGPPSTLGTLGRSWSWTTRPSPIITSATQE